MKGVFVAFYWAVLTILFVLTLPVTICASLIKKYNHSIPSRFLLLANRRFGDGGAWFHACSYGEVTAIAPLINAIGADSNVSVITQTGFEKAKSLTPNVRFLPYEIWLPFWVKRPKVLIVAEAELWLMLFFVAKRRGAKTMLINARISDRSYHRYKNFAWFYRILFAYVDEVYAQSETDKKRLAQIGARNITVLGNIKASLLPKVTRSFKRASAYKRVITLASTHIGEESRLLEQRGRIDISSTQIIIVPRHPERFEAVGKLALAWANSHGKTYCRFSKDELAADVVLCDTMGELVNIYAITDVTLLGGSFIEGVGGHNPLEPAAFNNSIISGKFYFNQKELYSKVEDIIICDADEVAAKLQDALPKSKTTHLQNSSDIVKSIQAALA
jgi:3-deoxy-D-manno-octulosonic-acid transferase